MGKIIVLDELTVNKIAAGEVIERPASVIKELVENSIDAGATSITVEIRRGGKTYMRVTDNGSGMPEDDILLAFEKHATSKIKSGDDLDFILTLGFRGEALASIAAVSKVELTTKTADAPYGTRVVIQGGAFIDSSKCGCPDGTTFVIRELFFNTPARFKFLKRDATEAGHIIDTIERIALAKPDISFRLINSGSEVLRTPGDGELKNAIFSIYGRDIVRNMKRIDFSEGHIKISGFAGDIQTAVSSRSRQSIFINGRYIKSRIITSAIDEAYKTLMMKGKHPFIVLKLEINPHFVDVNVHPTKMEVRFSDEQTIFRCVYGAITSAIFNARQPGQRTIHHPIEITGIEQRTTPRTAGTTGMEDRTVQRPAPYVMKDEVSKVADDVMDVGQEDLEDTTDETQVVSQDEISGEPAGLRDAPDSENADEENVCEQIGLTMDVDDNKIWNDTSGIEYRTVPSPMTVDTDKQLLREAQYIGQVFNTYIILQYKDEVIIIDQHAAHERVVFEELVKNATESSAVSQYLLPPAAIELTRSEYELYKNNQKIFTDMGFSIEDFGVNSILVRALPSVLSNNDVKPIIVEIIRDIMDGTVKGRTLVPDEKLYDIACKAAIKANMKLDSMEVKELLNKMAELSNPFTCPHGRPLSFRISKKELEKKFKRIV